VRKASGTATFESPEGERSRVIGLLGFGTVTRLLPVGAAAIEGGRAAVIDLGGVTGGDSAGLALLIEWLSVAKGAQRSVCYENVPTQLRQLAHLSEVDELLLAGAVGAPAQSKTTAAAG
jgi:phospholipid transport system transporter-binding protein